MHNITNVDRSRIEAYNVQNLSVVMPFFILTLPFIHCIFTFSYMRFSDAVVRVPELAIQA